MSDPGERLSFCYRVPSLSKTLRLSSGMPSGYRHQVVLAVTFRSGGTLTVGRCVRIAPGVATTLVYSYGHFVLAPLRC